MDELHVLMPTDVFPPVAGGSGWSAYALARALQARGHRVTAIVPQRGAPGTRRRAHGGVPVIDVGYRAPNVPFVQNYYRFERLWPVLRDVLVAEARRDRSRPIVIHAQHAQTAPAAVLAARALDVPVVATIRDAWPWHYFATGLLGDRLPFERQSWATAWLDLIGRLGPLKGMLAAAAIPYMRSHLRRRAALLAQADAVIAVSGYIRRKLLPIVPDARLHVVPNLVDLEETSRIVQTPSRHTPDQPFVLYVGKLQRNKGAHLLPEALGTARALRGALPRLLIAGNGELEAELRRELEARGLGYQILGGWIDHDEVLRLMRQADVLLFPSAWGEPLSRVLLEGLAVGACIAAIDTGGTSDAILDGVSGALVRDAESLGRELVGLLDDAARREQLRAGALRIARERFAPEVVAAQVEAVYRAAQGRHQSATSFEPR
ncbi:MAG TPA: glycosyltransferase family 4 protein [Herpetosiphonaceae bacterium]